MSHALLKLDVSLNNLARFDFNGEKIPLFHTVVPIVFDKDGKVIASTKGRQLTQNAFRETYEIHLNSRYKGERLSAKLLIAVFLPLVPDDERRFKNFDYVCRSPPQIDAASSPNPCVSTQKNQEEVNALLAQRDKVLQIAREKWKLKHVGKFEYLMMIMALGQVFPDEKDQTPSQAAQLQQLREAESDMFRMMDQWFVGYTLNQELTDLKAT